MHIQLLDCVHEPRYQIGSQSARRRNVYQSTKPSAPIGPELRKRAAYLAVPNLMKSPESPSKSKEPDPLVTFGNWRTR